MSSLPARLTVDPGLARCVPWRLIDFCIFHGLGNTGSIFISHDFTLTHSRLSFFIFHFYVFAYAYKRSLLLSFCIYTEFIPFLFCLCIHCIPRFLTFPIPSRQNHCHQSFTGLTLFFLSNCLKSAIQHFYIVYILACLATYPSVICTYIYHIKLQNYNKNKNLQYYTKNSFVTVRFLHW